MFLLSVHFLRFFILLACLFGLFFSLFSNQVGFLPVPKIIFLVKLVKTGKFGVKIFLQK